ncbi:hypothetical protein [Desulfamplus magnetovallimortis]|uniref:hypothetical protein n=1 Tax=Desulfamplus magnetovallimortis TaxID=1246637 RepID=UPI001647CCB2|nr:hypothetical protein [Desulfamplus magnetovallimortis]
MKDSENYRFNKNNRFSFNDILILKKFLNIVFAIAEFLGNRLKYEQKYDIDVNI